MAKFILITGKLVNKKTPKRVFSFLDFLDKELVNVSPSPKHQKNYR